jgi:hypothetical protein
VAVTRGITPVNPATPGSSVMLTAPMLRTR